MFLVNVNILRGRIRTERIRGAFFFGHPLPFRDPWLVLTQGLFALAELGVRGDLVSVKKSVGRNKLLPQGLAVYASPENRKSFEEEKLVSSKKGRAGAKTLRFPLATSVPFIFNLKMK